MQVTLDLGHDRRCSEWSPSVFMSHTDNMWAQFLAPPVYCWFVNTELTANSSVSHVRMKLRRRMSLRGGTSQPLAATLCKMSTFCPLPCFMCLRGTNLHVAHSDRCALSVCPPLEWKLLVPCAVLGGSSHRVRVSECENRTSPGLGHGWGPGSRRLCLGRTGLPHTWTHPARGGLEDSVGW